MESNRNLELFLDGLQVSHVDVDFTDQGVKGYNTKREDK